MFLINTIWNSESQACLTTLDASLRPVAGVCSPRVVRPSVHGSACQATRIDKLTNVFAPRGVRQNEIARVLNAFPDPPVRQDLETRRQVQPNRFLLSEVAKYLDLVRNGQDTTEALLSDSGLGLMLFCNSVNERYFNHILDFDCRGRCTILDAGTSMIAFGEIKTRVLNPRSVEKIQARMDVLRAAFREIKPPPALVQVTAFVFVPKSAPVPSVQLPPNVIVEFVK